MLFPISIYGVGISHGSIGILYLTASQLLDLTAIICIISLFGACSSIPSTICGIPEDGFGRLGRQQAVLGLSPEVNRTARWLVAKLPDSCSATTIPVL